jgi:hypothetical protein
MVVDKPNRQFPQLSFHLQVFTEDVAGGDMRQVKLLRDGLRLGAFASPWRSKQDDVSRHKGC